jgi:hypothetical protein
MTGMKQHTWMTLLAGILLGFTGCMTEPDLETGHGWNEAADVQGEEDKAGVVSLGLTGTDTIPTDEDCASVAAWVAHNADNLPTEYDHLAQFSVTYRRAIFHALSPAARNSLWQQHFQRYLAAHPTLSPEQVAFVKMAQSRMSPMLFSDDQSMAPSKELTAVASELESRATTLFAESEIHALLANLGPIAVSEPSVEGVACECSRSSDYCSNRGSGYRCTASNCDYKSSGCGTFWSYPCNGICYRPW